MCPAADAVELPGRDGDPQARPGAGRRLHGGAQAGRGHAAHRARARPDPHRGRRTGRRRQRRHRPTSPATSSTHALADDRVRKLSFTGSTGVGPHAAQAGRRPHRRLLDGARRQRPVPRARRRRPRRRRRRARCWPRCATAARPAPRPTASSSPSPWPSSSRPSSPTGWARCKVGPGTDESTQLGPMVNAKQRDGIADKVDPHGVRRREGRARRRRARRAGLLLPGHRADRRAARLGGRHRGGVRPGRADHHRHATTTTPWRWPTPRRWA